MRRLLPHLTIAGLLLAIALLSLHALSVLGRPPDPIAEKFRTAERTIVYQVLPDRGPRFRMDGVAAPIKLVTYAVVPAAYDPLARISYGLRLRIEDGGRTLWQSDVFVESRQSKGRRLDDDWRDEGTFTVDRVEITDERIVIVQPPEVPAGATLTMTLLGEPTEGLVRVFRGDTRAAAQREAVVEFLDEADRFEMVRSSTYVPWELIPEAEKDRRLRRRWNRMSALGERGPDYGTRTIFVSDFRAPLPSAADVRGIEVMKDAPIAINVVGPGTVTLASTSTLRVDAVGVAAGPWELDEPGAVGIDLPPGPGTLVVSTDDPLPQRFTMSGAPDVWLAPPDLKANVEPGELTPDRTRLPLAIALPAAPVTATVRDVPGAPWLGRTLRIDARVVDAPLGPLDVVAPALATLTVRFVGAGGRVISSDELTIGGRGSPFERLEWMGLRRTIGEPSAARVIAPPGATSVEITASRAVALRLYRWGGDTTTFGEPYRSAVVLDHHWRYGPLDDRTWWPLLPANHDDLVIGARAAELLAQVRLEPIGGGDDEDAAALAARPLVTVTPVGHPEQQRAREPVPADQAAAVLARWPPGAITALTPGVARTIDFGIARPDRARLAYEVPDAAVGGELVVAIGDALPVRAPITSTRGAIVLPRIDAAAHAVRVEAPAGSALFVDRPPVGDARGLYRERRVFSLAQPVQVRLVKRTAQRVRLLAIVYAPSAAASLTPAVRITVDGGRPRRRTGVVLDKLTDADRSALLPAAVRTVPARLPDLGGKSAGLPRAVGVTLLEDLVPGTYEIDVFPLARQEMWVRFVATSAPASAPTDPRQWQIAPDWGGDGDAP